MEWGVGARAGRVQEISTTLMCLTKFRVGNLHKYLYNLGREGTLKQAHLPQKSLTLLSTAEDMEWFIPDPDPSK
jgi:hypothetical protein